VVAKTSLSNSLRLKLMVGIYTKFIMHIIREYMCIDKNDEGWLRL